VDVTSDSPGGTPGVLNLPGSVGFDSGQEDTVVKVVLAVVEGSGLVERPVGGVNGDGDGLLDEGVSQVLAIVGVDVGEAGDGEVTAVELAETVLSGVGILSFGGDTAVLNDVVEGVVHQTTLAAQVSLESGTVDELLLGEGFGLGGLDELKGFEGAGGGEGPA